MKENESSSWLTPTTTDIQRTPEGIQKRIEFRESIGRKYMEGCLTEQVINTEMLPTPRACSAMTANITEKTAQAKHPNLETVIAKQMFPTPGVIDTEGGAQPDRIQKTSTGSYIKVSKNDKTKTHGAKLTDAILWEEKQKDMKMSLNPYWVEALMGLPQGWTALDGAETEMQGTWANNSWEEGIPRVIKDCPNRIDRIRMCGNGVVPQTACIAWRILSGETENQDS